MSKRPLPRIDTPAILTRLGAARAAMIELGEGCRPRSVMRASADQVIRNIDEIAFMLTGERNHFHSKGHGPSRYQRDEP